jgi:hypothetical protein
MLQRRKGKSIEGERTVLAEEKWAPKRMRTWVKLHREKCSKTPADVY